MSKCWNRVDSRPTFRYCLEVLQQINEQKNVYASTEAQFPHDIPYKYVSSDDSMSMVNEKLLGETSLEELKSIAQPSIPKYLELAYDESESQSNDSLSAIVIPTIEFPRQDEPVATSQISTGYEIPLSIDSNCALLDINSNHELNSNISVKSRTLSNSSTVSNHSDHFSMVPASLPPPPETCKRSSLILVDRDHHKIFPTATSVITRQSGWV